MKTPTLTEEANLRVPAHTDTQIRTLGTGNRVGCRFRVKVGAGVWAGVKGWRFDNH